MLSREIALRSLLFYGVGAGREATHPQPVVVLGRDTAFGSGNFGQGAQVSRIVSLPGQPAQHRLAETVKAVY